ncbi:beta-parvin-like [Brevipalpus obovatus]|uniref:beta-parvin-like n=1 Tax=Brevipalpus obovatus TaxID=246614 RepID=UPI003D9ED5FC
MTTFGSKSPLKSESFLDYLTIGRRQKIKNVKEVESLKEEGKVAIEGQIQNPATNCHIEEYIMEEYEERSMLDPSMNINREYQELVKVLINWINDELSNQRIIVKKLDEDLHDGQILGKLVEHLSGNKLDVIEVTLNEDLQRSKLRAVLDTTNRLLGLYHRPEAIKWSVQEIHNKNIVQIIHYLVALVQYYRPPVKLPENVIAARIVVQKRDGRLHHRRVVEQLTSCYNELGRRVESRDEFDLLFEQSPEKFQIVKKSLVNFVNKHLNPLNIECYAESKGSIDPNQFSDGLLLVFLIASVGSFFVPLGNIFLSTEEEQANGNGASFKETALSPKNYISTSPIQKLHNVNVAFHLMEDEGLHVSSKVRPEDIVNGDLKSVLRILYMMFVKYRHL